MPIARGLALTAASPRRDTVQVVLEARVSIAIQILGQHPLHCADPDHNAARTGPACRLHPSRRMRFLCSGMDSRPRLLGSWGYFPQWDRFRRWPAGGRAGPPGPGCPPSFHHSSAGGCPPRLRSPRGTSTRLRPAAPAPVWVLEGAGWSAQLHPGHADRHLPDGTVDDIRILRFG